MAPLKALPEIITEVPVIPDVGVKALMCGTLETTVAVGAEATGVPAPDSSLALTTTRTVEPTALAGTVNVAEIAPLTATQAAPELSHVCHW